MRPRVHLEGYWTFQYDPQGVGEAERWHEHLPAGTRVQVPHVWTVTREGAAYEGAAWYQRRVALPGETALLRLCFEGFCGAAAIWIDGVLVAQRSYGWTPLDIDFVLPPATQEFTLTVRLDNRLQPDEIGMRGGFRLWGGLHRPIFLEHLPNSFFHRWKFTSDVDLASVKPGGNAAASPGAGGDLAGDAQVQMTARILSLPHRSSEDTSVLQSQIYATLQDDRLNADTIPLSPKELHPLSASPEPGVWDIAAAAQLSYSSQDATLAGRGSFHLWEPSHPRLYRLHLVLDAPGAVYPIDEVEECVGIRSIATNDRGQLLLNGRRAVLLGVNRHDEHPVFGPAVPPALTLHDLTLMKEAHMTGFRPAHYPARNDTLDMADALGLMVIEEIPHYIMSPEQMRDPHVLSTGQRMFREMVQSHWNHPSVIAWSVANECKADLPESKNMIRSLAAAATALDPTRLVHFTGFPSAMNVADTGATLVGLNVYYGASSHNMGTDMLPGVLDSLRQFMAEDLGMARVPIMITEFGSEAVAGYHDIHPYHGAGDPASSHTRYTEERQAQVIADFARIGMAREYVAGLLVWVWQDNRYEPTVVTAGEIMRYGLLDWNGQPKLAYHVVADLYRQYLDHVFEDGAKEA
jgi:beta-glucuronidase